MLEWGADTPEAHAFWSDTKRCLAKWETAGDCGKTGLVPASNALDPVWAVLAGDITGRVPSSAALEHALGSHARAIAQTWRRISADRDPNDAWLDAAETEFLTLLRSESYMETQRRIIEALLDAWDNLGPEHQSAQRLGWQTGTGFGRLAWPGALRVPIGQSAFETVWRSGRYALHRYVTTHGNPGPPIVICYGLIGRHTVTDLLPDRSIVRRLLDRGFDVYALDWGSGSHEDPGPDMAELVNRALAPAIRMAASAAGRPVTLFGICQGGTLGLCHAALDSEHLSSLVLAGTPVDFHADHLDPNLGHGLLNVWLRALPESLIARVIDAMNGLPGLLLGAVFNQVNPVRTLKRYAIDLPAAFRRGVPDPCFRAMETWLADRPDLPARFARQWLIDLYRKNALVRGDLVLDGRRVDLGAIRIPVLCIAGASDHIIPPPCQTALESFLWPGGFCLRTVDAGHIGALVGRVAGRETAEIIDMWHTRHVNHQVSRD